MLPACTCAVASANRYARAIRIVTHRDSLEHGNRLLTVAARQHHAREIELRRGIVRRLLGRLAIGGLGLVEAAALVSAICPRASHACAYCGLISSAVRNSTGGFGRLTLRGEADGEVVVSLGNPKTEIEQRSIVLFGLGPLLLAAVERDQVDAGTHPPWDLQRPPPRIPRSRLPCCLAPEVRRRDPSGLMRRRAARALAPGADHRPRAIACRTAAPWSATPARRRFCPAGGAPCRARTRPRRTLETAARRHPARRARRCRRPMPPRSGQARSARAVQWPPS